ncbi:MAG: hypothetical protein WAM66_02240 [Acidobacteriaceae bacterium]
MAIPGVLALTGILSWVLGNGAALVLACTVAAVVGFFTLWEWLFRKAPTRFSTLMGMALLLGYGAGALNTWITLPRGSLTLSDVMGLPRGVLARGIGAVLLCSAILYFLGEIYEKPIFGRDFRFSVNGRTRTLVCLGALAMVGGYATHVLEFMGPASTGGHLSPAGAFLEWFYPSVTAIGIVAFLTAPRGKAKVFCGAAALILLLLFSVMGRRHSMYTSVEILLVLELSGYHWKGSAVRKALMIAALAGVVAVCSLAFMLFRIAGDTAPRTDQVTVAKRINLAGKMVDKGGAVALAGSATQLNLQKRTFILAFFAGVLDASMRKTPALGRDAIEQLQSAIPRLIYPNKNVSLSEEEMDDQVFGLAYGDEANSVLTGGATDFGLLGVIIYPLLMVALYRVIFDATAKFLGVVPLMFVALSLIYAMIETEMTLSSYFESLRVAPFFGLAIALFMALPVIKLRAE